MSCKHTVHARTQGDNIMQVTYNLFTLGFAKKGNKISIVDYVTLILIVTMQTTWLLYVLPWPRVRPTA